MIYKRLEELKEEQGVTWAYLNKSINAYRGKLTELKSGKTTLEKFELEKLAKVLNTTVDYLAGKTDIKNRPSLMDDLSKEELELLELYRKANEDKKRLAKLALEFHEHK